MKVLIDLRSGGVAVGAKSADDAGDLISVGVMVAKKQFPNLSVLRPRVGRACQLIPQVIGRQATGLDGGSKRFNMLGRMEGAFVFSKVQIARGLDLIDPDDRIEGEKPAARQ